MRGHARHDRTAMFVTSRQPRTRLLDARRGRFPAERARVKRSTAQWASTATARTQSPRYRERQPRGRGGRGAPASDVPCRVRVCVPVCVGVCMWLGLWCLGRCGLEIRRRYYCTACRAQNVAVLSLMRRNRRTSSITTCTCSSGCRLRIAMMCRSASSSSRANGLARSAR